MNSSWLQANVSVEKLRGFLRVHGEANEWDFKEMFMIDHLDKRAKIAARVELAKDVLAFANIDGGGHLIFGVRDRDHVPVGIPLDCRFDTTRIYDAVRKWVSDTVQLVAARYDIEDGRWTGPRRFGILYIAAYEGIAIPLADGQYEKANGQRIQAFSRGLPLIREGCQSCRPSQAALDRLYGGPRLEERKPLGDNLPPSGEMAQDFVGREREVAELWSWLKDPHGPIWLLAGAGGLGKSAVAYEFARRVGQLAPADLNWVVWLSAKERQLRNGEIIAVDSPDFWDLESLLDAIVAGYAMADDNYSQLQTQRERTDHVISLLKSFPCLLVADDINSLEQRHGPAASFAIRFITQEVPRTGSKVLLTSRKAPSWFQASYSEIDPLPQDDAQSLVASRIKMFRLDPPRFGASVVRRILKTTERNPLYIEDLLRLCRFRQTEDAISSWEKEEGDVAREYSLKTELDSLSPAAKSIVLACCLPDGPISFTEVKEITGLAPKAIAEELPEIQNLFLVSQPKLIEGVERFDVNRNLRTLALSVNENSDVLRRLRDAFAARLGQLDPRLRPEIASVIRQAAALDREGNLEAAVATVEAALQEHPNHPDLIGQMGIIFSRSTPSRLTDARIHFQRAAELKCKREYVYETWSFMEADAKEFQTAARAAELGLNLLPKSRRLFCRAGIAHSRLGQDLLRSPNQIFPGDPSDREFAAADAHLRQALVDSRDTERESRLWRLNGDVLQALVINCHYLGQEGECKRFLARWESEYPSDKLKQSSARSRFLD